MVISFLIGLYFLIFEITLNRTPGKILFRLRIISMNGGKINNLQLFIRNIFRLVDQFLFPGVLLIMFNKDRLRVGDLVAKTKVVEE
ncbi:RDD family protein [Paenibacillus sp. CF384]|uniref:RDD family protein n=1 Tax=Paenibacillus sp. CF384 TaxID=1884382 RepID=UPI000897785D|nr:RDD family protein [Paenibacillus sp. CF384]